MRTEPGYIRHRSRPEHSPEFTIDVAYEVVREHENDPFMHLTVRSDVAGVITHDECKLSRQSSPCIAKVINFIARNRGIAEADLLTAEHSEVIRVNKDIDERFAEFRRAFETSCSAYDSFVPGRLHRANQNPLDGQPPYCVDLHYTIVHDAKEGSVVQMRLAGEVGGKRFEESFSLPRSSAYNFGSVATRVAHKHGMPRDNGLIKYNHKLYDLMYADIRTRLAACSEGA
ncbi:DUF5064 family protein [Pseudomonas rustica]|jgi:hypothetical protein|uniref:DUF5064 family protein n=1 Tax=Pseudomonas TaxID=286 RepID=UPI0038068FD9